MNAVFEYIRAYNNVEYDAAIKELEFIGNKIETKSFEEEKEELIKIEDELNKKNDEIMNSKLDNNSTLREESEKKIESRWSKFMSWFSTKKNKDQNQSQTQSQDQNQSQTQSQTQSQDQNQSQDQSHDQNQSQENNDVNNDLPKYCISNNIIEKFIEYVHTKVEELQSNQNVSRSVVIDFKLLEEINNRVNPSVAVPITDSNPNSPNSDVKIPPSPPRSQYNENTNYNATISRQKQVQPLSVGQPGGKRKTQKKRRHKSP